MGASLTAGFSAVTQLELVIPRSLSFQLSAPLQDHPLLFFLLVSCHLPKSDTWRAEVVSWSLTFTPGLHLSLQLGDTSVPPVWSSPEPRTWFLTACLISTWMSNSHLRFGPPSPSFSQLSKGKPSYCWSGRILRISLDTASFSLLCFSPCLSLFHTLHPIHQQSLLGSFHPEFHIFSLLHSYHHYLPDSSNLLTSCNKSLLPCCICRDF